MTVATQKEQSLDNISSQASHDSSASKSDSYTETYYILQVLKGFTRLETRPFY